MASKKEATKKEEVIQGVLIADNFNDNFAPLTDDVPFALLPIANIPLIEISLNSLYLAGVEELFVFCCSHVEQIKRYIVKRTKDLAIWSVKMKVNIIVSETCHSLGDCMRDLDAKGLIRGTFVLAEAGAIGKVKIKEILEQHNVLSQIDKGLAMTMINMEVGGRRPDECPFERQILLINKKNRVLFHKRRSNKIDKKHTIPMEIFLQHSPIQIRNDLMDTRMTVCSQSVLSLFSDNFDFQTKDDFIRGILMNEEILGSTIYCKNFERGYASAVTSWRRYQKISSEILKNFMYPVIRHHQQNRYGPSVTIGSQCSIPDSVYLENSVIGDNVKIGTDVTLIGSYVLGNCSIENDCEIRYSVIGDHSVIGTGAKISNSCIIGRNVVLKANISLENKTIKATPPELYQPSDKLGTNAYIVTLNEDDDSDVENKNTVQYTRLYSKNDSIPELNWESDDSDVESELSYTKSPPPDDTKLFFTEVIDSLARGFEDKLQCDNLILEINSSRYAYNVTLREVNYNVSKAILSLPFQQGAGQQYWSSLQSLLVYFSPIWKNYIRSKDAMEDCLQAVEDVATSNTEVSECIVKTLNWFYDEDYLSEEAILEWNNKLDKAQALHNRVQPFIKWLQEAEEATSSDDE